MNFKAAMDALVWSAVETERDAIASEARRYASHYPPASDGRNTFILLAEWIEARSNSDGQGAGS